MVGAALASNSQCLRFESARRTSGLIRLQAVRCSVTQYRERLPAASVRAFCLGAMMGRRTKLNDKTQAEIVKLIETGAPIADACSTAGIAESTFYDWMNRGEAGEQEFSEFSKAVTRARTAARLVAVKALRHAMSPYRETTKTVETFTETRVGKDGKPYDYIRKTERETTTLYAGDWRAALEYLRRRDPANWQPPTKIEVNWQDEAIADIRAGAVTYEALAEAFDEDLATQLFTRAGVPVPPKSGEE